MAHRNRWFTELKNGWIFHGELLNNQVVCQNSPNTCKLRSQLEIVILPVVQFPCLNYSRDIALFIAFHWTTCRMLVSWQHLGDVVLALWYMMSETNTRSKTLHGPRQVCLGELDMHWKDLKLMAFNRLPTPTPMVLFFLESRFIGQFWFGWYPNFS